jgi:hypothetical protein
MKKLFFCFSIIILFTIFITSGNAQDKPVKFGIRLGPQMTLVNVDISGLDLQARIATAWGAVAEYCVNPNFSLLMNIQYSMKGAKYSGEERLGGYTLTQELLWKFNYLSIPLLAKVSFGDKTKLYIYGGPELAFLLSAKQVYKIESNIPSSLLGPILALYGLKLGDNKDDIKEHINSFELAGNIGFGFEFPVQNMTGFIETRGSISTGDILKDKQLPNVVIGEGSVVNIIGGIYLGILF